MHTNKFYLAMLYALATAMIISGCKRNKTDDGAGGEAVSSVVKDTDLVMEFDDEDESEVMTELLPVSDAGDMETTASSESEKPEVVVPETAAPEETLTEQQEMDLEHLKSSYIKEKLFSGIVDVTITGTSSYIKEYSFSAKNGKMNLYDGDSVFAYMEDGNAYVLTENGWQKRTLSLANLFEPFSSPNAEYTGKELMGQGEYETVLSSVPATGVCAEVFLLAAGYDADVSDADIKYCLENGRLSKMEANAQFTVPGGSIGDQETEAETQNGTITMEYSIYENHAQVESAPIDIILHVDSDYTPGIHTDEGYSNETFGIKTVYGDVLNRNEEKEKIMQDSYVKAGTTYLEESYAEAENGFVEIVSVPVSIDEELSDSISKYMASSGGTDATPAVEEPFCGKDAVKVIASRNGQQMTAYALKSESQVLFVSFIYSDADHFNKEIERFHDINEDLNWESETWDLESYRFTTPDHYTIDHGNSSSIYACMTSKMGQEYNIFLMSGSVEDNAKADIENSIKVISDENITTPGGKDLRYLVLQSISNGVELFTYETFLRGEDEKTVRYFALTTNQSDYFKEELMDLADNTEYIVSETENPS